MVQVRARPPIFKLRGSGLALTATGPRCQGLTGWIEMKTLFIEPGSPWENGYNELFNGKLRDELLNTKPSTP